MFNESVLGKISYGVYVVSALDNARPVGCVANCAVQLTKDAFAVSLNHKNYTTGIIKKTKKFGISILSENSNRDIISVFGFSSSKDKNKFENICYELIDDVPIIKEGNGFITLETLKEVELETHTVFIGKILSADLFNDEIPMTYRYYKDIIKGTTPKTAPNYIESKENPDKNSKYYRCEVCGYIYEGDIEKEPPNYLCPVCKQPKSVFKEIRFA